MIDIEKIAHVCHEANRALQVTNGEADVSPHFMEAPEWQVQSAYEGVSAALEGQTPEQLHELWCAAKTRDGWTFGPVKDAATKTHPCLVPYADLPEDQRIKDAVFQAIVRAFATTAHVERVAYADDIAEGGDPVPEDYERHFCDEDGEDWPCSTVRQLHGSADRCSNPDCPLDYAHDGPCAPKDWKPADPVQAVAGSLESSGIESSSVDHENGSSDER